MVPRELNLPTSEPLKTEKVLDGLYVVKGAYSEKRDYFAASHLYSVKAESDSSRDTTPMPAQNVVKVGD